jgi:hypothetical protein
MFALQGLSSMFGGLRERLRSGDIGGSTPPAESALGAATAGGAAAAASPGGGSQDGAAVRGAASAAAGVLLSGEKHSEKDLALDSEAEAPSPPSHSRG